MAEEICEGVSYANVCKHRAGGLHYHLMITMAMPAAHLCQLSVFCPFVEDMEAWLTGLGGQLELMAALRKVLLITLEQLSLLRVLGRLHRCIPHCCAGRMSLFYSHLLFLSSSPDHKKGQASTKFSAHTCCHMLHMADAGCRTQCTDAFNGLTKPFCSVIQWALIAPPANTHQEGTHTLIT